MRSIVRWRKHNPDGLADLLFVSLLDKEPKDPKGCDEPHPNKLNNNGFSSVSLALMNCQKIFPKPLDFAFAKKLKGEELQAITHHDIVRVVQSPINY
jgi:hypothetical protein